MKGDKTLVEFLNERVSISRYFIYKIGVCGFIAGAVTATLISLYALL
jgi:hypothetical protein